MIPFGIDLTKINRMSADKKIDLVTLENGVFTVFLRVSLFSVV